MTTAENKTRVEWVPTPTWGDSRWELRINGEPTGHRILRQCSNHGPWEVLPENGTDRLQIFDSIKDAARALEAAVTL